MPITPGTKLRHYEIVEPIGAGGMGEVYRARDTTLARDVAIKVLKDELARDGDRLERFEREAKLLAQLSHPNIATIHGLEKLDGQTFLVMELVEGETLAERIARGGIPVDEVVALFVQIADGLQAAHERGIIHRDLKPANIKIAADGTVKILDFGLAKAFAPTGDVAAETSQSPTLTKETALGVILGTAAYMSPEQARGKPVDTRTDVWAFGACLYEATTGTRAFEGESIADVIGAVVQKEPDWSRLSAALPRGVDRVVRRCLTKDVKQRLQAIGDARFDIQEPEGSRQAPTRPSRRLAWLAVGFVIGTILASFVARSLRSTPVSNDLVPQRLTSNPVENSVKSAAISPDGRYLAFLDAGGLFLRLIETGETHRVDTPEELRLGGVGWYPDGTSLFFEGASDDTRGLWRISVLGGDARKLSEGQRATISPDGSHIGYLGLDFPNRPVYVMGPNGENPRKLLDAASYWELAWSPDGEWLLVSTYAVVESRSIEAIRVDGSERKMVFSSPRLSQNMRGALSFRWAPDNRLFVALREEMPNDDSSNLWSFDIDPTTLELSPTPSRMTFLSGVNLRDVTVTTDGSRMSFLVERELQDVFVGELEQDAAVLTSTRRLTLDDRRDRPSGWLSDSRTVLFSSERAGSRNPYRQGLDDPLAVSLHTGPGRGERSRQSADDEWILYWYDGDLMRIPAAGGPPELVMSAAADDDGNRFDCARGRECILGMRDTSRGEYVFFSLDAIEGKGEERARIEDLPPFVQWALSPDGMRIAVAHNTGAIRLVELDSGQVSEIRDNEWTFREFITWDAAGRGVFIDARPWNLGPVGRYTGTKELVYVRLGDPVEVFPLRRGKEQLHIRPTASPDGRYLAYAVLAISANAWMLEGF